MRDDVVTAPRDPAWTMPASVKPAGLHHVIVREHCRGAKHHADRARFDEDTAYSWRYEPHAKLHQQRANEAWVSAIVHVLRAALVCAALMAAPVEAQSDALMLARTCVSERGWRTDTDDCAAINDVVHVRMERRGVDFASALRALAPRLHHPECRVSRRWLCELDEDAERPAHLGHARWEGMRRDAWLATLAEARDIVAGLVPSPCLSPAHVWGSDEDTARRERTGFRFVAAECPGATFVNRFGFLYRRIEE